jgi:hypothetical protein
MDFAILRDLIKIEEGGFNHFLYLINT